jgi:hypothetical protein
MWALDAGVLRPIPIIECRCVDPWRCSRIYFPMERSLKLWSRSAAVALSCCSTAAAAWSPDVREQAILLSGKPFSEVIPSTGGAGQIEAAIDIAAPPKIVWTVMNDCGDMNRIILSMTSCRVLSGDARYGWDIREQITKGNFFVPTIRNVVRNDYQPYTLIRFHKAGGDLKSEEGEWRLEPLNGGAGTRVVYVNRVAANIVAPASLVREGMKRDTAKVLVNLRRVCVQTEKLGA